MALHELELLAPAGKMEVLHSVLEAGADAVYLGGKRFNMRGLRPEYNFSDEQLQEAVEYTHRRQRRLYITLNNLYAADEITDITDYLLFLKELGVDGLIVQDLGIASLCRDLDLGIPLHASVQMGIANLEAVRLLAGHGFTRVILSKNVSLEETAAISAGTGLGIEFFVHGDLCVAHTGQCYMSSIMTGASGNRGKCRKPCRWQYQLQGGELGSERYRYYLAHKDLCLYPHLQQLVEAGVCSFKIEGRMRSAAFLHWLVSTYRRALDRLIADPGDYRIDEAEMENLQENRIRNYTAASLLQPLDWNVIDLEGEREPVKSAVEILPQLDWHRAEEMPIQPVTIPPQLTVRVGGLPSLEAIMPLGMEQVVLGSEIFRQNQHNWTPEAIAAAAQMVQGTATRLFLETPRIVSQKDLPAVADLKQLAVRAGIDGVIVNDLGSLRTFQDAEAEIWAGYGLNIFNPAAAQFLSSHRVSRITASLELSRPDLQALLQSGLAAEVMVQGPLPCMVSDYCMIRAARPGEADQCPGYCMGDDYRLRDQEGQAYRIISDAQCRTYLYAPYELCLMPFLPQLAAMGARSVRIDGQFYSPRQLREIVVNYQQALASLVAGGPTPGLNANMAALCPTGLTAGAYLSNPAANIGTA